MDDDELIARWIEEDPGWPGAEHARMADNGASVWAIIGYLRAVDGKVECVAKDYHLPPEAVAAAVAYYKRHTIPIEARLMANAAPPALP